MIIRDKNGNIKIVNLNDFNNEKEKYLFFVEKKNTIRSLLKIMKVMMKK